MVSSITVAKEFINLAKNDGRYFTPMQLLKLVYIAHGWMFGFFNEALIDDDIEAWKYGPVIPNLYQAIKSYGNRQIENIITLPFFQRFQNNESMNEEQKKVVEFVYKKYGKLDGIKLSMLTHQANTPWDKVFDEFTWGKRIPNAEIHQHYRNLYQEMIQDYEQLHYSNSPSTFN